jgi:hypothetical protein
MSIGQLSAQQVATLSGLASGANGTSAPGISLGGGGGKYTSSAGLNQVEELTHLAGKGLSIRIIPANGGTIISIRNENSFGGDSELYVIPESQNIAEEIGKIITLHCLKA